MGRYAVRMKKPKIVTAPRTELLTMPELEEQFLEHVLGEPAAFITDESWITDFIELPWQGGAYDAEKERIWAKIEELYGVDVRPEKVIVNILKRIKEGS